MGKFKTMKVFRFDLMPEKIKQAIRNKYHYLPKFFEFYTYEKWSIIEVVSEDKHKIYEKVLDKLTDSEIIEDRIENGLRKVIQKDNCIASDWLCDNGAEIHEWVLIHNF